MQAATHNSTPFDHWVIDNFFGTDIATQLAEDFYSYDDDRWLTKHSNELENKKLSTHWDWYPKSIYSTFFYLCSKEFISELEELTGIQGLIADFGLHAGGMHIHSSDSGRLNLHQDSELHPKLGLKRRLNIVIYLNQNWDTSWGGELELWSSNPNDGTPDKKVSSVAPLFNRAVIFDTTQNSWHGVPNELKSPPGEHRKSIALFYYTANTEPDREYRLRARFYPTEKQKNDPTILKKIEERSTY